jgi:autotransporter-associated beta strand protein
LTYGVTPTTDIATFNTTISGGFGDVTTPIVIDSGRTISGITFGTSAGAYQIGTIAGNTLTLSAWGKIQTSGGTGSNAEVINAPLKIYGGNVTCYISSDYTNAANTLSFGGTISGASGATVLSLNGANTGSNAITGVISNGTSATFAITKYGAGSWTMNGSSANTYTGGTTVGGGVLTLANAGTVGTGSVTVNAGGTLTLDNGSLNAGRIGDAAAVSVGGSLNLIGNASADTSETAGVLTPASGGSIVTLTPGSGQSALLTFSSIGTRAGGNTTLYRGTGLGSALGADTSNIIFTTGPTVSTGGTFAAADGVGTLGTTSAAVLHGALFDSSATGGGSGFATYEAGNGIRLLDASTEQDTSGTYPVANGNTNVRLNLTGAKAITGVTTNTLHLDNTSGSAVTVTNTGTALNAQNGLLFSGTSAITLTGGTFTQPVGTSDLVVLSSNSAGVTIGTALTNLGTTASTTGVTVGGSGNITLSGGVRLAPSGSGSSGNQYFNVNSSGTTTLASVVSGGGSSSTASATLTTNVNAGTLKLSTGGSLGTVVATNGGGYLGTMVTLNVASGATFDLNGINSTISYLGGSSGGTITNSSGTTSTLVMLAEAANQYNYYYGNIAGSSASNITGNLNIYIGSPNGYTLYRRFLQTLSGNNSYTGTTTVDVDQANSNFQGLNINSSTAIGVGTLVLKRGRIDNTSGSAITLTNNNAQQWNGSFTFTGTNSLNMGTGAVTLGTANPTVTVTANTLTVGGNIGEGAAGRGITKAGTGTLVLGGTNTYTGATIVNAGALTVSSGATMSDATAPLAVNNPNTNAGTTVSLNLNSAQTVGSLSGTMGTPSSGTNIAQINLTGASTVLTVNQTAANSFAGRLTGTGGLTLGSGSNQALTLTGTNTYTGATAINGGTLVVNGSLASGSAVSVGASGTLGGSGTVGGTVAVSGTLSPGNSPGLLTTGAQTWSNGGNYNWQVVDATGIAGTGFDSVSISSGGLDLSGLTTNFNINLWSLSSTGPDVNGDAINFDNSIDQSWTLVSNTGDLTSVVGSLFTVNVGASNGTSGFSNALGGGSFSVVGTANSLDLVFTAAIPEPSTYAAIFGALALAGVVWKRRRA